LYAIHTASWIGECRQFESALLQNGLLAYGDRTRRNHMNDWGFIGRMSPVRNYTAVMHAAAPPAFIARIAWMQ